MTITIEELKSIPIDCSEYFPWKDYMENKEKYEKEISEIQIDVVSEERLVSCGNYIFNHNYYHKHKASHGLTSVDVEKNVYLREQTVCTLIKADKFLRANGFCLFLRNGYRSTQLQKAASDYWGKLKNGDDTRKRFSQSIHPPHASGGVFDLEIFDIKKGECLLTKDKTIAGNIYPYQKLENTSLREVKENIRLLHNLLTKPYILDEFEVFIPHPYEHWHYGRGDRHSKFFSNNNHKVIYDTI